LARAGTGGGLEWLFSVIAVELRTLSAVRHTLIEARCIFFMKVYDQVSAKKNVVSKQQERQVCLPN
jgi:hypothetical protein